MLQNNINQKQSQKEEKNDAGLTFVDFLRPEFLIGSLLRGAKLPKYRGMLKLVLWAVLFVAVSTLVFSSFVGLELYSLLNLQNRFVDIIITIFIFYIAWGVMQKKRT